MKADLIDAENEQDKMLDSNEEDSALLSEMLALNNSTVLRWNLRDGALQWASNAAEILHLPEGASPPKTIYEWMELLAEEDRPRFNTLHKSFEHAAREVKLQYRVNPDPASNLLLHIKQTGRVSVSKDNEPEALISTLRIRAIQEAPDMSNIASISDHALTPQLQNDRRGYHYPQEFITHLTDAIAHSEKTGIHGTFLLLAINNLAMIINGYGFEASEHILSEIKQTIAKNLNAHDHVERIHRDQMGIILADCSREEAEARAVQLKTLLQNLHVASQTGPLHITSSIGCVSFPDAAKDVPQALDKAFIALNNQGELAFSAYEDSAYDSEKSREQMALAKHLNDAIVENRLRLAFQPIISSKSGKTAHYECLLRIIDKEGKITSAGPLIPIAERMGLIEVIDRLVLEKVIAELKLHPEVSLAFNISSVTTANPSWVRYLAQLLEGTENVASRMIVEITETALQRDLRETAYFVASVQALGCLVSLDDFGSGYTSFRQLKALSLDMLKIDGTFIRDLLDNADNRFFVKTLLDFTTGYGLPTVAEFVESGEVAKLLMSLGVSYMQGYYFSQPLNHRPWLNEGEYKA